MSVSAKATPPTRRTYLKAGDRRAQILDVAKTVFSKRGYHVANIADICEAASIGRGTLYQYFENKRDVLLEVVLEIAERIEAVLAQRPSIDSIPGVEKTPTEMIVAVSRRRLREILEVVFVDEPTLRLLLSDARGVDSTVDEVLARVDALLLGSIEADTRAAMKAGLLRKVDPKITAQYIFGGIEKIVRGMLASREPIDLDHLVAAVVDIELFGLLKRR